MTISKTFDKFDNNFMNWLTKLSTFTLKEFLTFVLIPLAVIKNTPELRDLLTVVNAEKRMREAGHRAKGR